MMSISFFTHKKNSTRGAWNGEYIAIGGAVVVGVALIVLAIIFGGAHSAGTQASLVPVSQDGRTGLEVGTAPVLGNEHAPHTIVEFFDFQCVACVSYFTEIKPQIQKEFIDTGKARLVGKVLHFIDSYAAKGMGEESVRSAKAALCAQPQGKFWDLYDAIFTAEATEIRGGTQNENSGNLSEAFLLGEAKRAGIDAQTFTQCLSSSLYDSVLEGYLQDAMVALEGKVGTPSVFIDGVKIENPFDIEEYKKLIQ